VIQLLTQLIYAASNSLVVLYGSETWSVTLKEGHEGYENRVLRRILEYRREEVAGGWRRLHNEKFHNLYYPPSIIRMIK
jgi:hypothetical protein